MMTKKNENVSSRAGNRKVPISCFIFRKVVAEDRATQECDPSAATSLKAGPGIARFPASVLSADLSSVFPRRKPALGGKALNSTGGDSVGNRPLCLCCGSGCLIAN